MIFCGVPFVFLFLFSDNSLPFTTDEFTLCVSSEVLLLSCVLDRLIPISFGYNEVIFAFKSGDFSWLVILCS